MPGLQPAAADGEWHTWRLFWSPSRLAVTLDAADPHDAADSRVNCYDRPTAGAPIEAWPFYRPFYLLANIAVGGNGVDGRHPSADWQASSFILDYVRVYALPDNYSDASACPPPEFTEHRWSIALLAAIISASLLGVTSVVVALVVWCRWQRRRVPSTPPMREHQAGHGIQDPLTEVPVALQVDGSCTAVQGGV